MKLYSKMFLIAVTIVLMFFQACEDKSNTVVQPDKLAKQKITSATVTVFATCLNNPRGLKFGPNGYLYVAEGGTTGGNLSTICQCDQVPGAGPYLGGFISRISKISRDGNLYVSNNGFGIPVPGAGEIVKITLN
jgi:hypothetical protein